MLSNIEAKIVNFIGESCRTGAGSRTTEVGLIAERLDIPKAEVADSIRSLVERGNLKCSTETWQDYCWILTPDISLPRHHKPCSIFGL